MLTASELKALLTTHRLRLTQRLGQHHLVDRSVIERLMRVLRLTREQTVVEIGAGLGALTEPLAERAGRVIGVEIDPRVCALLRERLAARRNVTIVCGNILTFDWAPYDGASVVGAIPYHITSPILLMLGERARTIRDAWLIVQEEVAARLTARAGTKAYGRLSVLAQYHWAIATLMRIPRSAFFPQPDVDSTCLHLTPRDQPRVAVANEVTFFEMVKAAFGQRRKTLVNCLIGRDRAMSRPEAEALVREAGLPVSVRGEALSLEQFAALSNAAERLNSLR